MKNKGFTLIELLAVIVILAVIALIATPVIMRAINDAKKGAAKDSGYGYMSAAEYFIAQSYNDDDATNDVEVNGAFDYATNGGNVKTKGTVPTDVDVVLVNGKIDHGTIVVNGFTLTIVDGIITDVSEGGSTPVVTTTPDACFGLDEDGSISLYRDNCPQNVVIPSNIGGVNIYGIQAGVFSNKNLTSVVLPSSLIWIGQAAFYGNQELTSITIPSSVLQVYGSAFYDTGIVSIKVESGNVLISGSQIFDDTNDFITKYASGKAGTYTRSDASSTVWTKQ